MNDEASGDPKADHSKKRRGPMTIDQKPLSVHIHADQKDAVESEEKVHSLSPEENTVKQQESLQATETKQRKEKTVEQKQVHASSRLGIVIAALIAGGAGGIAVNAAMPYIFSKSLVDPSARLDAIENVVSHTVSRPEIEELKRPLDALREQVTTLEPRLSLLEGRVAEASPSAADDEPSAMTEEDSDALYAKISELEEQLSEQNVQFNERLSLLIAQLRSIEQEMEGVDISRSLQALDEQASLKRQLSDLNARMQEKLGAVDSARLAERLDEQKGEIDHLAKQVVTAEESTVSKVGHEVAVAYAASKEQVTLLARLTILGRLQDALNNGRPFGEEINILSNLGMGYTELSPLKPFANKGIGLPSTLRDAFSKISSSFENSEFLEGASVWDKIIESASRLVRIQPVGADASPQDIASRIEAALRRDNAVVALEEWKTLPEKDRFKSNEIGEVLQARVNAQNLVNTLMRDQLKALEASLTITPIAGN